MAKTETAPAGPQIAGPMTIVVSGVERGFDINDPKIPEWIEDKALSSGEYPYDKRLKRKEYEKQLERLQIEMAKLQTWQQTTGHRVLMLFEGRDAAGKGGTIGAVHEHMNPRNGRIVALTKPTETERGQWYFQRYVAHFPTAGEFVMFDRSWYNRAGVEPVMGFCTPEQHLHFLREAPRVEKLVVNEGISLFKIWLEIGQEMQLKRFHDRRQSLLTNWKFSLMDVAGMSKWDEYTRMRDLMIGETHSADSPWIIVKANDKRRARIETMRHVLSSLDYAGRDLDAIGKPDPKIIGQGPKFL